MVVIESNQIRFETMSFKENEFMMEVRETAKFDTENVGIRRSGWAFAVSVQQEGRALFITPNYSNFKIALNTKAQIEQALREP